MTDEKFMQLALNLSKKNIGITAPNPTVACVVVKDGEIISSGVTQKNGRPHAEFMALAMFSDKKKLEDAILYTTLEPCYHYGQTDPCVDLIIQSKIKKVAIATIDDDERVFGRSVQKLKDAGIQVVLGVLEYEAREINRGFFKSQKYKIPFTTLKLAVSLDGKIATKTFDSKWISSTQSRRFAHYLRSKNDAIMIGVNTLIRDNPSLNCRIEGLQDYSPKKIIVSSSLDFGGNFNVFSSASEDVFILTCNEKNNPTNYKVIHCKANKNGQCDMNDGLKKINELGINSMLVEGGSNIATSLIKENLVDELVLVRSPKIIGSDGINMVSEMCFDKISDTLNCFKVAETLNCGYDIIEIYKKND
jgi:diaminohydroxyphosphoribosylaminopyrimidine deaminase/5-amino-6-(5-phosphoribosylamino)uracil reductase